MEEGKRWQAKIVLAGQKGVRLDSNGGSIGGIIQC